MSRRFWLALILLLVMAPLPSQAQGEPAPYIYYFSDKIDAFVVERADGTDTHVLGDGLMALTNPMAFNFYIDGPGWSPSGQWFAWTAAQVNPQLSASKPYLVKADGSRRIDLLDNLKNAVMAWAPHDDLLLVVAKWQVPEQERIIGHTVVSLVNPAANSQRVLKNDISVLVDYDESALSARWLDDNHAIAEYGAGMDASGLAQTGYLTVERQGRAVERHFAYVLSSAEFWINAVSPSGNITYRTDQALVVENLITGKRVSFAKPDDEDLTLHWSPDGRYGLLLGSKLWLLMPEKGRLGVLLDSYKARDDYYTPPSPWSPGGSHALLISDNKLYHIAASNGQIEPLPVDASASEEQMWSWISDSQAVIFGDRQERKSANAEYQYKLHTYDFDSGTHTVLPVDLKDDVRVPPRITPDGHYLAYMNDGAVIVDLQNKSSQYFSPAADSWNSAYGGEVKWNQDGQWLLTFDDGIVAGGGHYRHLGIVRADGTLARDLKSFTVAPTDTTFNWLPPQVKPEYLPPALKKPLFPQPQKVLLGTDWMISLAWSPDGQQIAGGTTNITTWDVDTGQSTIIAGNVRNEIQITWQQDAKTQVYRPVGAPINCPKSGPYICIFATSPDGKQVVAVNAARTLGVFDSASGQVVHAFEDTYPVAFAYSPDGTLLAFGSAYMNLRVWDTRTWDNVVTLPSASIGVAFSPDGKQLALASAWNVELWDVATLLAASK